MLFKALIPQQPYIRCTSPNPDLIVREQKNRFNYVKDYDGGTHMECYVHPTVPYMDLSLIHI